ncbi:hypothetical protein [Rhodoferax sp.]|uniref:hypothetical protein n=1 Tax=Rhodoferax sp. TaxID=50421 RepID=UPI0025D12EBC|nr:hypothetical protein [Rhodoferax sp.]
MNYSPMPSTWLITGALALTGTLLAGQACAMSLRELQALEMTNQQGENHANYYLIGVMEGALEAHLHVARNGAKAVVCPKGRDLEPSMARNLYDAERQRHADVYEADMPVPLVMTNALKQAYPC